MQQAPIPVNEQERLESLYALKILDTPAEERFDRITRLATRLFKVPISTLTLIDSNREWFKSCQGLDKREGERAISFCGHALLDDNIFVIPDTLKDPRFADNPMVVDEPYIRFYAGVALTGPDGLKVGTFCIKDRKPRQMNKEDIGILKDLAVWAELELNMRELGSALEARRKVEESLIKARVQDEAILESIGEGLIAVDNKRKILVLNKVAEILLGWKARDMVGREFVGLPLMDDKNNPVPVEEKPVFKALKTGQTIHSNDYAMISASGMKIYLGVTVTPVALENQIIGAVIIFRDISREKEVDRAKSEFISLASHQLRTPLGIIKWYMDALKDDDLIFKNPQMALSYLDEIYNSNERLIKLVEDLLDVSRIEQSRVKNEAVLTDVLEFIKLTLKQLEVEAQKKGIKITFFDKTDHLPKINIDQERFREVLENLMSNAVKFTDLSGQVEINISNNEDSFQVDVTDNGMGIEKEDQPKIFTRFFRTASAVKKDTRGAGLGLFIVKSYIEGWGGRIWFESEEGKGAAFHFSLPFLQIQ